jgi:putative DNA-invertase from lambdoid prophage Rac
MVAVYGYRRVSTNEQEAGASLAEQERRIKGATMMLEGKIGYVEPEMVQDIITGSVALQKRPNGGQLWAKLQRGDYLIAAKLDRLFRSAEDALSTARQLQDRGVSLVLVDMGSDPVTGNGISKLFFTMLAAIAEFERTRIAERMDEGRKGKKAKGGHIGGHDPYGYRVAGSGRDAKLVPVDAEQEVIARARELRGGNLSLRKISNQLVSDGYLNRQGGPFTAVQIERMVKTQEDARPG